MNSIRLLDLDLIPPLQTQSYYHALAEQMTVDSPDTILLCRPSAPYLCLGYHQVFENTFNKDECARRGLPVLRRRLGGGATYLDKNQIFYQCVFHHSRVPAMLKDIYASLLSAPVSVLRGLGLHCELRDTNEIEVDGKRISGTGGGRIDEACVVVGNILLDFDFESMTAVWNTPSESFRALAEKALRERLVTLNDYRKEISYETLAEVLAEEFSRSLGRPVQLGALTDEEIQSANEVAKELTADSFLSLHKEREEAGALTKLKISARAFIHADEMQLDGFKLNGSFLVMQDVIQEAILDSEPANDWNFLQEQLRGAALSKWKEQILFATRSGRSLTSVAAQESAEYTAHRVVDAL
jgi:lipoate-protein ligase A